MKFEIVHAPDCFTEAQRNHHRPELVVDAVKLTRCFAKKKVFFRMQINKMFVIQEVENSPLCLQTFGTCEKKIDGSFYGTFYNNREHSPD
jgi:hypothetical protein